MSMQSPSRTLRSAVSQAVKWVMAVSMSKSFREWPGLVSCPQCAPGLGGVKFLVGGRRHQQLPRRISGGQSLTLVARAVPLPLTGPAHALAIRVALVRRVVVRIFVRVFVASRAVGSLGVLRRKTLAPEGIRLLVHHFEMQRIHAGAVPA